MSSVPGKGCSGLSLLQVDLESANAVFQRDFVDSAALRINAPASNLQSSASHDLHRKPFKLRLLRPGISSSASGRLPKGCFAGRPAAGQRPRVQLSESSWTLEVVLVSPATSPPDSRGSATLGPHRLYASFAHSRLAEPARSNEFEANRFRLPACQFK